MSWITIVAMVMFSMSMVLAFEKKGKTWQRALWRLTFVISPVLLCIFPCDAAREMVGGFLAVIFTLGLGVIGGLLFFSLLNLVCWIFGLEMCDVYDFLLGAEPEK